jgi:hypothetical protein
MKVKFIASGDLQGGANIAAFRLLQGLKAYGLDVGLVVSKRFSKDPAVSSNPKLLCNFYGKCLPYVDPLPKLLYPKRHRDAWSCNLLPNESLFQGGIICISRCRSSALDRRRNPADTIHRSFARADRLDPP